MFDFNEKTRVMGILNVTPDSFSDGGKFNSVERAVLRAHQMVEDGADIIDIGGESTRPGYEAVSVEEEKERVVPVIQELKRQLGIPVSIDTYKAEVAEAALEAGADIINDIWGAKHDRAIADLAARYEVPIILMHNRKKAVYTDFWEEVKQDTEESIQIALKAGVKREQIWLDPGIGFGKTAVHNVEMMQLLGRFTKLGYPVLLGTSRKSFIGKALGGAPANERLEGSLATVCYGVQQGCHIVRVHDVKETVRTIRMMDILTGKQTIKEAD
ncbi:dihydropteroate synthase [Indiicoccus explosivorum]|uniref:dihydropteroate synthase n=1 Tax=Indiicoccus explosivorum TaxID=1917864 RepID=UPI000B42CF8E|nr:dihydropteroate synthase [Indiicoccus explosivorum]